MARSEGRLPLVMEADEDTEHGIMHRMDEETPVPTGSTAASVDTEANVTEVSTV